MRQKAAVLVTLRQVSRTPSGSENGACVYGGNSGTRESQLFPDGYVPEEEGYRLTKSPGVGADAPPQPTNRKWTLHAVTGTHTQSEPIRYRSASEKRSAREEQLAVVVEHSTERPAGTDGEGGELRPNGPTEGKATPGTTFAGWKDGRDAELTNRLNAKPARAREDRVPSPL